MTGDTTLPDFPDVRSGTECIDKLSEHRHHRIRHTESRRRIRDDTRDLYGIPDLGARVDVELVASDVYCFTCDEWVGLADIPLTGTPRDASSAYYYHGPPEALRALADHVDDQVRELLAEVVAEHPEVDSLAGAVDFLRDRAEGQEVTADV
ncbi:MAG: hypothetical protein ABEH58_06155 [Haloplanus sp.]